jgi:hypothetical protein
MSTVSTDHSPSKPQFAETQRSILRWLFYCWGVCLELLGIAFMGAVVVVFFGQVDTRLLLALTAAGMVLFYGGWFCVRQASCGPAKIAHEGGERDARGAGTRAPSPAEAAGESSQRTP